MSRASALWQSVHAFVSPDRRYRSLAVMGDRSGWVLDHEAAQVARVMRECGYRAVEAAGPHPYEVAYFSSRDMALRRLRHWCRMRVAVCFPYYHGYPGEGDRTFDDA